MPQNLTSNYWSMIKTECGVFLTGNAGINEVLAGIFLGVVHHSELVQQIQQFVQLWVLTRSSHQGWKVIINLVLLGSGRQPKELFN